MADVALNVAPCIVPDAVILVAPVMAPVLEIPPELLFIPPVIEAPPEETVKAPAEVMVPDPVVRTFPEVDRIPSSVIVS